MPRKREEGEQEKTTTWADHREHRRGDRNLHIYPDEELWAHVDVYLCTDGTVFLYMVMFVDVHVEGYIHSGLGN